MCNHHQQRHHILISLTAGSLSIKRTRKERASEHYLINTWAKVSLGGQCSSDINKICVCDIDLYVSWCIGEPFFIIVSWRICSHFFCINSLLFCLYILYTIVIVRALFLYVFDDSSSLSAVNKFMCVSVYIVKEKGSLYCNLEDFLFLLCVTI